MTAPDLIVILPVYQEEAVITEVVTAWIHMLDTLRIDWRLRVRNDGSRDKTAARLNAISHPRLDIIHAQNQGHGPAILAEYRRAVHEAPWVFQTDSDGETHPRDFPAFWEQRDTADLLIGYRQNRGGPLLRRCITAALRRLTRILFGKGIRDVNCPYRLFRAAAFRDMLTQLPADTFAPNVLISAHALRQNLRIREHPIHYQPRSTGQVSIRRGRLLRAALRATRQTLRFARAPKS